MGIILKKSQLLFGLDSGLEGRLYQPGVELWSHQQGCADLSREKHVRETIRHIRMDQLFSRVWC